MKALIPALLALTAIALPAHAESPSRQVRYGDLDLASNDGQAALDTRLRSAVRGVCAGTGTEDLRTTMARRKCRREASERAAHDAEIAVAGYGARAGRRLASGR